MKLNRPAFDHHSARIRLDRTVQDIDERALAGAVLANQGVNLAANRLEVHAVQGQYARKSL